MYIFLLYATQVKCPIYSKILFRCQTNYYGKAFDTIYGHFGTGYNKVPYPYTQLMTNISSNQYLINTCKKGVKNKDSLGS